MKALFGNLLFSLISTALVTALLAAPTAVKANNKEDKSKEDKKEEKNRSEALKRAEKLTAEQLAEIVIIAYGGRAELQQVRNNCIEEGFIRLSSDDKDIEGRILRKFMRKEGAGEDQTRIDVELPTQKLTFGFNGYTVWAARDGIGFTPSPEAEKSFYASLVHNYDALLKYKEKESAVERAGSENVVGIDTLVLDLTHKNGDKTRYFISAKTYRILHLEYELKLDANAQPTKFRESFFDFRPIQNTLVPAKSMLYENGRFIQEIRLTQVKYHTKIDEELFLKF